MRIPLCCGLAIALLFIAINPRASRAADSYRPRVGQVHPDFVLPRIDNGRPLSLASLRGKKVLIVHFASW